MRFSSTFNKKFGNDVGSKIGRKLGDTWSERLSKVLASSLCLITSAAACGGSTYSPDSSRAARAPVEARAVSGAPSPAGPGDAAPRTMGAAGASDVGVAPPGAAARVWSAAAQSRIAGRSGPSWRERPADPREGARTSGAVSWAGEGSGPPPGGYAAAPADPGVGGAGSTGSRRLARPIRIINRCRFVARLVTFPCEQWQGEQPEAELASNGGLVVRHLPPGCWEMVAMDPAGRAAWTGRVDVDGSTGPDFWLCQQNGDEGGTRE